MLAPDRSATRLFGGRPATGRAGDGPEHPANPDRHVMTDAMSPSSTRPSGRKRPSGDRNKRRSALDAGFDRWLNTQLHKMYDPVLEERVPDELNRLLEAFDEAPPEGPPPAKKPSGR